VARQQVEQHAHRRAHADHDFGQVSSTRIADFRNERPVNIAVYQITVSPAAMPNSAMNRRFLLPG
jgi:hypothetical protein